MVQKSGDNEIEQRVIDDVQRYGWHVVMIEDNPIGPKFAYSIGMFHTLNHPEIIIFGFDNVRTMGNIINLIGEEVRSGKRFEDCHEADQILEGYSCAFRNVPADVYPDYLGYAMWYYRPDEFPVLQCIWPDRSGNYPWQSACHAATKERQPILGQVFGWPFDEPKNRAVFTTDRVLDGTHPVLHVTHDKDGDWQFLCGTTSSPESGRVVSMKSIIRLHPSLSELSDPPEGWTAIRKSPKSAWQRRRI